MSTDARQLSTAEGFLCGGLAACIAVSSFFTSHIGLLMMFERR
jgi:hypothetical protein